MASNDPVTLMTVLSRRKAGDDWPMLTSEDGVLTVTWKPANRNQWPGIVLCDDNVGDDNDGSSGQYGVKAYSINDLIILPVTSIDDPIQPDQ